MARWIRKPYTDGWKCSLNSYLKTCSHLLSLLTKVILNFGYFNDSALLEYAHSTEKNNLSIFHKHHTEFGLLHTYLEYEPFNHK